MPEAGTLLVVEDEPVVMGVLTSALVGAGYQVWKAVTAAAALELAREHRPDLILLDVGLPDFSGVEVCRRIKADPNQAETFVVMVSGAAVRPADKVAGLEVGADDYLLKPIELEELLARVRTWMRLRHTSAALRASEEHYRQLVETLPDAVILLDLDARFLSVNPMARRFLGGVEKRDLRRTFFDFVRAEDHPRMRENFAALLRTGVLKDFLCTMVSAEGAGFPAEITGSVWPRTSSSPSGFLVVVRDVSEPVRVREKITLLAEALRSIHEFVWVSDERYVIRYVNQATLEAFGYAENELLGGGPEVLNSHSNPAGLADSVSKATASGGWEGELIARRKDGSEFPVFLSTSPIRDEKGGIRGYVGVGRDISEVRRLERGVQEASEREQRRFGEMLHDGLCQRLFSTAVSCNLLKEKLSAMARPEADDAAQILAKLDGAIGEARGLAHGLSLSNLAQEGLVAALMDLAAVTTADSRVTCETECSGAACVPDEAASAHLYRIAREAVHNAVKHARPRRIVIRLRGEAGAGSLEVEDDGIGMDGGNRARAGLGLEMMRSRARMIGGSLEIRRSASGGTTIACAFPLERVRVVEAMQSVHAG